MKKTGLRAVAAILLAFCATFTTAVAASAATSRPASAASGTATHASSPLSVSTAGAGTTVPDTEAASCTSSRATWVHMYTTKGTECFGYTGTVSFGYNTTYTLCAGNNYGHFGWYNPSDGVTGTTSFYPGWGADFSGLDITEITITSWSGSHRC